MPDALQLGWRQYRLERRMFWRNPSAAFFNFALPLLLLAGGGAILSGNQHNWATCRGCSWLACLCHQLRFLPWDSGARNREYPSTLRRTHAISPGWRDFLVHHNRSRR